MNENDLIGKVAAEYLRSKLPPSDEESEGVSRFLLDKLTGEQVNAICQTILADEVLRSKIEIKIPKKIIEGFDLPKSIITEEKTTYWRNAKIEKKAILLANTNDDQEQSLKDLTTIGKQDLISNAELWVRIARTNLQMTNKHEKNWVQALKGLNNAINFNLNQFSAYVSQTRICILKEQLSLIQALGCALPTLLLPCDGELFLAIKEKDRGQKKKWEDRYKLAHKRSAYLQKQLPNGEIIEIEVLKKSLSRVKDLLTDEMITLFEQFISEKTGWSPAALSLLKLEWGNDHIEEFFMGLKKQKTNLATQTRVYLNDEFPETVTEETSKYLRDLAEKKKIISGEEEIAFYENHRYQLEQNSSLKTQWEKMIYGKDIECEDFILGILEAAENLYSKTTNISGFKKLTISTSLRKRKSSWENINTDLLLNFGLRYKGLMELTKDVINWDVHYLFNYKEIINEYDSRPEKKFKPNVSKAQKALCIGFKIGIYDNQGKALTKEIPLIWRGNSNKIGQTLYYDFERLSKHPMPQMEVYKSPINKKGKLQQVSLSDVDTLQAAYNQKKGTLFGKYENNKDLLKIIENHLKKALIDHWITDEAHKKIANQWEKFKTAYIAAIQDFSKRGVASVHIFDQVNAYEALLTLLQSDATSDLVRKELWQPIMSIGNANITGDTMSIVAPWHPLRLASMAIQAKQFANLLHTVFRNETTVVGDSKFFFNQYISDLGQPYYPEVSFGFSGNQAHLLTVAETVNDYSLMEQPVATENIHYRNENPNEVSKKIENLIMKYLDLQPHEASNLNIVLYDCDSVKLPKALLESLTSLQEKNENIRCQVILRNRDFAKLSELYTKMGEILDGEAEGIISSEMTKDFMARLRIGFLSTPDVISKVDNKKFADIVFLQEIISRKSQFIWAPQVERSVPTGLEHIPPRWSKKKTVAKEDLKSVTFLTSPSQPSFGWAYLKSLQGIVDTLYDNNGYALPAKQISFQDDETKTIIDEAHKLGEWIVNYDEILSQKLLRNQGVNVIKYQHHKSNGPNLIVSTNTNMNLLQILVKKKIIDLGFKSEELEIRKVVNRFIEEANLLSGDILLRAAKRGKYASELLGVVLSKELIKSELENSDSIGWVFLDEYASWLGKKEEQIADLMAICPIEENGRYRLEIILSECKYVDVVGLSNSKKNSRKQLLETAQRMVNALEGKPKRIDRDLWLARISDLMIEGIELNEKTSLSLDKWREGVRTGLIPINIKGYSHVFTPSIGDDGQVESEQIKIHELEGCYQEVFNRDSIKNLIQSLMNDNDLKVVRASLGDERPWNSHGKKSISLEELLLKLEKVEDVILVETDQTNIHGVEEFEAYKPLNKITEAEGNIDEKSGTDINTETGAPISQGWANEKIQNWLDTTQSVSALDDESLLWLTKVEKDLQAALRSYELHPQILGSRLTPNAAIVRLKGSDRLRVEDIEKKRSQLLTTHALQILNIMARPGEIVVFIERRDREIVMLKDIWKQRKIKPIIPGMNMNFVIGVKEVDGEILYLNLGGEFEGQPAHAPHTLIAGTTGSGKSILIQNLILDICATNDKKLAKIYLIDPKFGVDYSSIEELPHLQEGIIDNQQKAERILKSLVEEMDKRYRNFRKYRARDIKEFNDKVLSEERLPLIFLIHDEFADWMLEARYKSMVSATVQKLSVKARAAGIHLIFATQRPDKDVLPMQLRDNLGNRLILKVESAGTSEISLNEKGAENLLGRGHLAAKLQGEPGLIIAQVPYISNDEVDQVIDALR